LSPAGYYLNLDEIFGFVRGTATSSKLRALATLRKGEFRAYEQASPAERFETSGMV
jgi:pyruvate,water dikinase